MHKENTNNAGQTEWLVLELVMKRTQRNNIYPDYAKIEHEESTRRKDQLANQAFIHESPAFMCNES